MRTTTQQKTLGISLAPDWYAYPDQHAKLTVGPSHGKMCLLFEISSAYIYLNAH